MRNLLFLFFFFVTLSAWQHGWAQGVALPDASQKLKFLPERSSGAPTRVPDPAAASFDRESAMAWWREARFGLFIHWGLYAVPAGEWNGKTNYGEWIRTSAQIPLETYDTFRTRFNPMKFDADAWVRLARDAGMKYIVITTKHHDGFCLFDTKETGFNIMNSPFGRDPMISLAEACRKYQVKLCFYYSIMDWHHPDYLPRREWEKDRSATDADFDRYFRYMKAQLKELLTRYGDIGVLWFDGEWENTWNEKRGREIYHYVKSLQPGILVNNRVGAGRLDMEGMTREGAFGGDFGTPEQQIPPTGIPGMDWETCMTMNDHWGYNRADKNFKSTRDLLRMIADIASKGGNFLLNVGPTAEGLVPAESVTRLEEIGRWMSINGESVHGTSAGPFTHSPWGRCTQKQVGKGYRLYFHVFDRPDDGILRIDGILNTPLRAWIPGTSEGQTLVWRRAGDGLQIELPSRPSDSLHTVVALDLSEKPDITAPPVFTTGFDQFTDSLAVAVASDREKVQIRYSTGNEEPGPASPEYPEKLVIKETTTIGVRCFRDGQPVSGTARKTFTRVQPWDASATGPMVKGLVYGYYEGNWDSLPDFNALRPVSAGLTDSLTFSPRRKEDYFAFVYEGYLRIPESSVYEFSLRSDDGSRLLIDDRLVVDNDGLHGPVEKSGQVALARGPHRVRIEFFEKTGGDNLTITVASPFLTKRTLPNAWLYSETGPARH